MRREGDDVLFLNPLRHREDARLSLRLPLDNPDLTAAMAVRGGGARAVEGRDYRGAPVFAAIRPIAGTGWHLAVKIDRDEEMQSLYDLVFWVGLVTLVAVAVIALLLILFWRQLLRAHRLELLAQAVEEAGRFRAIFDAAVDGILIADAATRRFVMANPAILAMLGAATARPSRPA